MEPVIFLVSSESLQKALHEGPHEVLCDLYLYCTMKKSWVSRALRLSSEADRLAAALSSRQGDPEVSTTKPHQLFARTSHVPK